MSSELESQVEEESRAAWAKTNEEIKSDTVSADASDETSSDAEGEQDAENAQNAEPSTDGNVDSPVDFD